MSAIAYAVIAAAKNNQNRSLLNWDDSYSFDDLIENIKDIVFNHTGWKYISVDFENNILEVYGKSRLEEYPKYLLAYNAETGKEIYGRLRQIGFHSVHIKQLKKLLE